MADACGALAPVPARREDTAMTAEAFDGDTAASLARSLLRTAGAVTLGTRMAADGAPYTSLVLLAVDAAAQPLLLLSDLAQHTANIGADPRVSLLVDGTADRGERLSGPRASVQGRAAVVADPALKARFLRRHPGAAAYADFGDFRLYRVAVDRVHLVAGFGRIAWIDGADVLYPAGRAATLLAAEDEIVEHMNTDHAEAVELIARRILGQPGEGWSMAGVDPEGCDMVSDGRFARLTFTRTVDGPESCRRELVRITRRARRLHKG